MSIFWPCILVVFIGLFIVFVAPRIAASRRQSQAPQTQARDRGTKSPDSDGDH